MLDPKRSAEIDQNQMALKELLPPVWWGLYEACKEQGFTPAQSFSLVQTYILSMGTSITPPPGGPENA